MTSIPHSFHSSLQSGGDFFSKMVSWCGTGNASMALIRYIPVECPRSCMASVCTKWMHPASQSTDIKVACLVRQSLSGQAPLYLADDCCLVSDSTQRSLRSADVPTCVVPRTLSSYGDRTFAAAGPRLWNSLPVQLRNPDITYGLFRRQMKAHLFREA